MINGDRCVSDQRIKHHKNLSSAYSRSAMSIPPQVVYLQVRILVSKHSSLHRILNIVNKF